jgi:exo-beta-1,3-glucanase (GH17 family)
MRALVCVLGAALVAMLPGCASHHTAASDSQARRPISFVQNGEWVGANICYGPHRDGQTPDSGPQPTREQVAEDARIMAKHWRYVRMYGAGEATEFMLQTIREEKLPLKLMLGIWIAPETQLDQGGNVIATSAENAEKNRQQVAEGIRLANTYRNEVAAIGVGNETQVFWSAYRCTTDSLIKHIRTVRAAVSQPVTTCDGYEFWLSADSDKVAPEVDFAAVHIYAMWNKQRLENALAWSQDVWAKVNARHPGLPFVVTEIGWATDRGNEGYQAEGVLGPWGEQPQEVFYRAVRDWANSHRIPYFWFQAFDEKWKGGREPNEVEKHWGVYFSNRKPKLVMQNPPAAK